LRAWPSTMSLTFGPDGKTLFFGSNFGCVTRWDVTTGEPLPDGPDPMQVYWVRFLAGKHLEMQGEGFSIRDWTTGRELRSVAGGGVWIGRNVSPDGKLIIDVDQNQPAIIRDAATQKEVRRFPDVDVPHLWFPQFTPDGKRVVAGSPAGVIFVWDAASGERLH